MIILLKIQIIIALPSVLFVPIENSVITSKCGYKACHPTKEGFINVHIVPHSHDDVGWRKTVDQYYYGLNESIQVAGVQYIIGTVVEALRKDSKRRFIQVETSFFWKWYQLQNKKTRAIVKDHVKNGKMEFVGGGWSMNDEATTHYQAIIDQFTWGLKKLNETFGKCGHPKVGWQIDPFGHTREMAAIFAQMGYDAFIFARTDFRERQLRESTKTNQMVWRSNPSLGSDYDIFTSILFEDRYGSPPWFCFDMLCDDPPIIDDPTSPFYNVHYKINLFMTEIAKRVAVSPTNHVIIPLGGDFTMQNAHMTYVNIDKLIHHTNLRQANGSRYNLLYSTPSCYIKAIYDDTKGKRVFPSKTDDFLPYGTGDKSWWTGYYTSRPTFKRNERQANNYLQVSKQLQAISSLNNDKRLDELRSVLGIFQHHDGITGTEKQHVSDDYTRMLFNAIKLNEYVTSGSLSKLSGADNKFTSCFLANISQCALTETHKPFVATVYNPLSRRVNKYVRVPVIGTNYSVTGPQGYLTPVQLLPIPQEILDIPGRKSNALYDLVFLAENIPPLGFLSYFIIETSGNIVTRRQNVNDVQFENVAVSIDPQTGLVNYINFAGLSLNVNQNFEEYSGVDYVANTDDVRNSGAYVFHPTEPSRKVTNERVNFTVYEGDLVTEIHQTFNSYVSQIVRIYSKEQFVEFDWLVGPLATDFMRIGVEVISVFQTDLATDWTFYTETNGKQLLKRIKDYRPSYNFNISHSIAANYYPVTSRIVLRDEERNLEFAVINDRTQGGTSLNDGEVELMVHRVCTADDGLGVDEVLKEYAYREGLIVRGSHYVVAGQMNSQDDAMTALEKDIIQRKVMDAWTFLSPVTSLDDFFSRNRGFSGLTTSLPRNVQILTLEPWSNLNHQLLLRLEHIFDESHNVSELGKAVSVDLKYLFSTFNILDIEETTLGANEWKKESKRLQFDIGEPTGFLRNYFLDNKSLKDLVVVLQPTEIRTFIVTVELLI